MLYHLDKLLVDLNILCLRLLTILQRDLDAELVKLDLLVLIEATMFKDCVLCLELFE